MGVALRSFPCGALRCVALPSAGLHVRVQCPRAVLWLRVRVSVQRYGSMSASPCYGSVSACSAVAPCYLSMP